MRYFECTWFVSISNWTSFELSPWVWQAQLSPTASVDDIIELCLVFFDEIMLPWQVLKIAKSKLQPDDPLNSNLLINNESSSSFVCSASVHRQASADGSMVTQLKIYTAFTAGDQTKMDRSFPSCTTEHVHQQRQNGCFRDGIQRSNRVWICCCSLMKSWLIMFFLTQNLHSSDRTTGESVLLVLGLFLPI